MTAAMPLQWENETPITTGQVGGGPWIISRHSKNLATAADFVTWATTVFNPTGANARAGLPGLRARWPTQWLAALATNPYFAADPTPALKAAAPLIWTGVEPCHLSGPARLVQHRRHGSWSRASR